MFSLKDLGTLNYFLGIEVQCLPGGMHLSQQRYITELLRKTKMLDANPQPTPMPSNLRLSRHTGDPVEDATLYRSVVGALQYATITRPEISFSVNKVSQFMHSPLQPHWKAVKRILRYLRGTLHFGLFLHRSPTLNVTGFSDADWATDSDDRRSTSGMCVYLGKNLVTWS